MSWQDLKPSPVCTQGFQAAPAWLLLPEPGLGAFGLELGNSVGISNSPRRNPWTLFT